MFSSAIVDLGVFIGAGAEAGAFSIISGFGSRLVSALGSGSVSNLNSCSKSVPRFRFSFRFRFRIKVEI
jgi:hypothetical protein